MNIVLLVSQNWLRDFSARPTKSLRNTMSACGPTGEARPPQPAQPRSYTMSTRSRSAERPVKAGTLDRRDQKAQERAPQRLLKPHEISKFDKGLKNY
jgi:hypothetical protein